MTDASSPDAARKTFRAGRYTVVRILGEGTQGETFEALDATTGRRVAIKHFRIRGARSWKDVELAEREALVLASLSHPALPKYVEHFEEDGALCLVTDLIDGEDLATRAARGVRMDDAEVTRLLRELDRVLQYLHDRRPPVVHRDVKPSNVIRRADGSFVLIDFGAVRDKLKPSGGSTVVGTFGYMAPEQFQGRSLPASDVYAAGATALRLLTGIEPEAMPHKGLAIDVAGALNGASSPAMVAVLTSLLEPDPDKRPSRIGPLLQRLEVPAPAPRSAPASVPAPAPAPPWQTAFAAPRESRDVRHERRRAKHKARAEQEMDKGFAEMRQGLRQVPPVGRPFVRFGLTVAVLAVWLALGRVVPAVLRALAVLFGRPLRDAAQDVSDTGAKIVEGLSSGLEVLREAGRPEAERLEAGHPEDVDVLARRVMARRIVDGLLAEGRETGRSESVRVDTGATAAPREDRGLRVDARAPADPAVSSEGHPAVASDEPQDGAASAKSRA